MPEITEERREILKRARAALVLKKHRRWAAEMTAAGWTVTEPNTEPEAQAA
jgi:hypothetical protein